MFLSVIRRNFIETAEIKHLFIVTRLTFNLRHVSESLAAGAAAKRVWPDTTLIAAAIKAKRLRPSLRTIYLELLVAVAVVMAAGAGLCLRFDV